MTRRSHRAGRIARTLMVVACLSVPTQSATASIVAWPTLTRALVYRCRIVAIDRGDTIALSLRLRTNEPRDRWRIRIVHDGERVLTTRRLTDAHGDLKVRALVADAPGPDDVRARARHLAPRAVCTVAAVV